MLSCMDIKMAEAHSATRPKGKHKNKKQTQRLRPGSERRGTHRIMTICIATSRNRCGSVWSEGQRVAMSERE